MDNKTDKKNHFLNSLTEDPKQLESLVSHYHREMKEKGKSLQEVMNISESYLEEIYGVAHRYYNLGKYKEAISLFYFLISIAPKSPRFVFGFAASLYQIKDYEGASIGFYMAHAVNQKDPLSAFYAADSLLKIHQEKEASGFLDLAIKAAGQDATHSSLVERCKLMKSAINQ